MGSLYFDIFLNNIYEKEQKKYSFSKIFSQSLKEELFFRNLCPIKKLKTLYFPKN